MTLAQPLRWLGTAGLVALLTGTASASPLPEMIGAPGGSGGWNARVTGASAASTYFNPALLGEAPEDFTLDFFVVGSSLRLDHRARPAGADIGASIDKAYRPDGSGVLFPLGTRALPTANLDPLQSAGTGDGATSYIGIGLVKRLLGERLVFGLQVYLPAGKVQEQSAFYVDEREQYFSNSLHYEMLGDRLTLSTISFGVGSRVSEQLSLGVGFTMGLATQVTSPVFVPDAADYSTVYLDNDLSVSSKLSPHFGVIYRPVKRLTLAATLHTPSRVEVSGKNRIRVSDTEPVDQVFTFVNGDEPLGVALAGAWGFRCDGQGLALVGTATWRKWSDYVDRHGERPLDEWNDAFSFAAGARYVVRSLTVQLDGLYAPSPVPTQDGRTNYVDNDRVGVSTGASVDAKVFDRRLRASLTLQGQRLLRQVTTKSRSAAHPAFDEFPDDSVDPLVDRDVPLAEAQGFQSNNPGYPGYTSQGWLYAIGVSLETFF